MKLLFIVISTLISCSVAFPEAYRNVRIQRAEITPITDDAGTDIKIVELETKSLNNDEELTDITSIQSAKKPTEDIVISDLSKDSKAGDDLESAAFGWGGYGGYGGWGGGWGGGFGGFGGFGGGFGGFGGGYGGFGGFGRPWGYGGGFW